MELIRKYKQGKLTTADVRTLNNTVICLMILAAVTSIVWSFSIYILTGDFYNRLLSAKLVFQPRDFKQMDTRTKEIFYQDLGNVINESYTNAAIDSMIKNNEISMEMLIMPDRDNDDEPDDILTTPKPKVRKIAHLFQISSNSNVPDEDEPDEETNRPNTDTPSKIKFDPELDRKFLASMTIDMHQTHWHQSITEQFIYSFPFLSEILAIIWSAMCLIYQSGLKYWGLPKPWRIVIPSIVIFTFMTASTLTYTILANGFIKTFCHNLRSNLTNPNVISCGRAMSVLRPIIRVHEFQYDVYLNLFCISYMLTLVLWFLALLIMVLRYIFAIDFQLVDIPLPRHTPPARAHNKEAEFTEVLLNSPQHQLRMVLSDEFQRSEDDFQSAKSNVGEVATPLLEHKTV